MVRLHGMLGLALGLGLASWTMDAIAAEQAVLKYGPFERSLSVAELTTLAEQGEASPTLERYLNRSGQSAEDVQRILTREVPVDVRVLDRVLNSPLGDLALNQLTEAIYPPSGRRRNAAMRSALVLSASEDNHVSLIEVIQNYPTRAVHIDGNRLASAYAEISRLSGRVGDLLDQIPIFH